MTVVRRWWPVLVALAMSLFVQKVLFESHYDVSGHAGEHLSSATAPFAVFVLLTILLYTTPQALRQPFVLVAGAAWQAAAVLVLVGNVRVIDVLVREGLGHTPTDKLPLSPTIDAAHSLANRAPWLGVVAALALTGALWVHRLVSRRVAIGAAVLNVIFPPWILPGAGVIVLAAARVIAFQRASTVVAQAPT